jgi:iron transport multicopper oxidase
VFGLCIVTSNGIVKDLLILVQAGLASIFVEAPGIMQQNLKVPSQFIDQCKNLNRKFSGNAAGFDDEITFIGISAPPSIYPQFIQAKGYISLAACIISALIGLWAVIWYSSFDSK